MTSDPGALWMRHMREGAWEKAWTLSDAGLAAPRDWTLPRHLQRIWDGTPPDGKHVLVRCYHGLGDTVQFARFLPMLRTRAASVTLWAQPVLIPLLRRLQADITPLPLHDGVPECSFDLDIEIMELPHLFRVTPETLPARVPYLHPPRRTLPGGTLHLGLVWQAGDWDNRRSIPSALLAPLARLPGISTHVLQRGPALRDWPRDLGRISGRDDPLETASLMTALDLVISVDSFPAHLAGALGRPCWTLLQHDADWRWMEGRADSPWYPTMRLIRQPRPGDWEAVAAELLSRLAALQGAGAAA